MRQNSSDLKKRLVDATGWIWIEMEPGFWAGRVRPGQAPIATILIGDFFAGGVIRAKNVQSKSGSVADVLDWIRNCAPDATRSMSR